MFKITLCLPSAAQQRSVRAMCMEYFARQREQVELYTAAANDDALFLASDLIFLSAAGAEPEGLETARRLRQAGCRAAVIFLASGPEYAMEAFGLSALQYFVPPISAPRLYETLDRVTCYRRGPAFAVPAREGTIRVAYADIEYVECTDHILHFHLRDGSLLRSITLRVPLAQALAPLLGDSRFYQPHRSYVVNLEAVRCLSENEFEMEGGARIPVPRSRTAEARAAYLAAMRPAE